MLPAVRERARFCSADALRSSNLARQTIAELACGDSARRPRGSIFTSRCRSRQSPMIGPRRRVPFDGKPYLKEQLTPRASFAAALKCRINTFDQLIFSEGLVQVANRPAPQYLPLHPLVRKCGNKYRWHMVAIGYQTVLQLDATQAGHLDIGNKTSRSHLFSRTKEFLGRTKSRNLVTERSDQ